MQPALILLQEGNDSPATRNFEENPRKTRNVFIGCSYKLSGYVFNTTQAKQIQTDSYINPVKYLKTYIVLNYSAGDNIFKCLDKISIINITKPTKPTSLADESETEIYKA